MVSSRLFAVSGSAFCAAAVVLVAGAASAAPATRLGAPYEAGGVWFVPAADPSYDERGLASEYSGGRRTASGEAFDPRALTAAHATLPLPGVVEVTNLDTGKRVSVRINDRGAYAPGRILSLSPAAARALGMAQGEAAHVRVRYADTSARVAANMPRRSVEAARPSHARYGVQVGAFADRSKADRAVVSLASAGRAQVTSLDRQGVTLWRVTLGPLSDEGEAREAQDRARDLGFLAAHVVSPTP